MSDFQQLVAAVDSMDKVKVASLLARGTIDLSIIMRVRMWNMLHWMDEEILILHRAIATGNKEIVTMLLDAGAPINALDSSGWSACAIAVITKTDADMLELLIARGADVSAGRFTPLSHAASCTLERCAFLLVKAGARVDEEGRMLGELACMSSRILRALIDRNFASIKGSRFERGETPLHVAAQRRLQAEHFDLLVNVANVDVAAVDEDRNTCTHTVAYHGVDWAVDILLKAGTDIDSVNNRGQTPLHVAVDRNRLNCVSALLAYGADVLAKDADGRTLLQVAMNPAFCSAVEAWPITHTLLAAGASMDECSDNERMQIQRFTTDADLDAGRRRVGAIQFGMMHLRHRALQVCIGLQSLEIDALSMCEILQHSSGRIGTCVAFHHWWKIATTVKHYRREK